MTDTSVVFNVIGKETGVGSVLGRVKSLFKSTGSEGAAAMRVVDHEVEKLDHDIHSAKDSLASLAREFAKASTAAERLSVSRQMKRQSAELGQLTKARNLLPSEEELAGVGAKAGQDISKGIEKSMLENVNPMMAILAGMAVGSAPFIGAAISGAIVGGAGLGGVIGGVMIASKDARVQSAWHQFADSAKSSMQQAAAPFVPAMQDAIHVAGREFNSLVPTIRGIFANSARYLAPLTEGLAGFVSKFSTGFATAVARAGPVIAAISQNLPRLGESLGHLFEVASEHAEAGANALNVMFEIVTATVDAVSTLVGWLSKAYEIEQASLGNFGPLLGTLNKVTGATDTATSSAGGFQTALDTTGKSANYAAGQLAAVIKSTNELADANISVYEAETNVSQAVRDSTDALKKNGHEHDVSSAKGRANREVIANLATTFNTATDANVKAGTSAAQATRKYDQQRASFIKAAQAAGYTAREANNLADKMLHVPKSRAITISSNAGYAKGAVQGVINTINNVPRAKHITFYLDVVGKGAVAAAIKVGKRAGGGPVRRGQPYLVGEEGPELVVPQADGDVMTAGATRGALRGGQSGVAMAMTTPRYPGRQRAEITVNGPRQVAELLRYLIRTVDIIPAPAS
jgi:acetolactate synthase regulatory subunit